MKIKINKELTNQIYITAEAILNNSKPVENRDYLILPIGAEKYSTVKNFIKKYPKEFNLFGISISRLGNIILNQKIVIYPHSEE